MSHKLLEKIDDIVADNRITEDEYITICSLLKRIHGGRDNLLITNLREEIVCLVHERIDKEHELDRAYKSRELMENLNRQLHKDLKTLRDEYKQNIADKIIENSHLKKELKDLTIKYNNLNPPGCSVGEFILSDIVDCCCGSVIKRSGLSRHLKTKKHRAYIGEL